MKKLTKKDIFKCKLAGEPVEIASEELQKLERLELLTDAGVWERDPLFSSKFWSQYGFTVLYPMRLIDDDGQATFLPVGAHITVDL